MRGWYIFKIFNVIWEHEFATLPSLFLLIKTRFVFPIKSTRKSEAILPLNHKSQNGERILLTLALYVVLSAFGYLQRIQWLGGYLVLAKKFHPP
jgi:hypothetical protein